MKMNYSIKIDNKGYAKAKGRQELLEWLEQIENEMGDRITISIDIKKPKRSGDGNTYNADYLKSVGTAKQCEEYSNKLFKAFDNQARYLGNGIYSITNCISNDASELFQMFIGEQLIVDGVVELDEDQLYE